MRVIQTCQPRPQASDLLQYCQGKWRNTSFLKSTSCQQKQQVPRPASTDYGCALRCSQASDVLEENERQASVEVTSWLESIGTQISDDQLEELEFEGDPDTEDPMKSILRSYRSLYNGKSFSVSRC